METRNCVRQPKVARNELPWENTAMIFNLNEFVAVTRDRAATALRLGKMSEHHTQGNSFLVAGLCAVALENVVLESLFAHARLLISGKAIRPDRPRR